MCSPGRRTSKMPPGSRRVMGYRAPVLTRRTSTASAAGWIARTTVDGSDPRRCGPSTANGLRCRPAASASSAASTPLLLATGPMIGLLRDRGGLDVVELRERLGEVRVALGGNLTL